MLTNSPNGLLSLLVPSAIAQVDTGRIDPCVSGDLTCNTDLASYIGSTIPPAMFTAFFGILFAMLVFYGFKLAVMSRSDSAMTDTMSALAHAFVGSVLVLGSIILAESFGTVGTIAPQPVEAGILAVVIGYIVQLVGAVLILNLVVQGFRMIAATDDGNVSAARTNMLQSIIGAAMVILAAPILQAVMPGSFSSGINEEIVGIANFLATIFGLMAALSIVVAGIMLVVSVDESLKDRAKSVITASIVALIVVMTSAGLINILLPQ